MDRKEQRPLVQKHLYNGQHQNSCSDVQSDYNNNTKHCYTVILWKSNKLKFKMDFLRIMIEYN